ncbi:MAG TPA: hypothetical protein PKD18_17530 [Saprospiraceae bacterium]|nr:hypothetical protein [Saprospiraceae bacterium]
MIDKKHFEELVRLLYSADDYDVAMRYFMDNLGVNSELMSQSINPPVAIVNKLFPIYKASLIQIASKMNLKDWEFVESIKFFYYPPQNFVHGMIVTPEFYGVTIFFPNLKKGAMMFLNTKDGVSHFARITSIRSSTDA